LKALFFGWFLCAGVYSVNAQYHAMELQLESALRNDELANRKQNQVKSVQELSCIRCNNDSSCNTFEKTLREFDHAGNSIRSVSDFKNKLPLTCTFTYNNNEKPLENKMENFSDNGAIVVTFAYDNEGRLSKETTRQPDNPLPYTINYFYNEQGFLAKEIRDEFQYTAIYIYEYNSQGKCIKTTETNSEFEGAEWISLFEYNSTGRMISQKRWETGNDDTSFCYASYDVAGHVTEIKSTERLVQTNQLFKWSGNGNLQKKQEWFAFPGKPFDLVPDYTEERQFDVNGNLVKTTATEIRHNRITIVDFVYSFYQD
jgi:hypothetical protein